MVAKAVNGMPTKRAMEWGQEQVALAVQGQLKASGIAMAIGSRALAGAGIQAPGRLERVREWWEQEHVFGYGLILPAFVLIVCLVAYPFGMAIYFSLSDYWVGSPGSFVGFENFRDILGNEVFLQTVCNSFVFTAIARHPQGRARRVAGAPARPQPARSSG